MRHTPFLLLSLAIGLILETASNPAFAQPGNQALASARQRMVREEIEAQGIKNAALLDAMREVPRDQFIPTHRRNVAYLNVAITYGDGHVVLPPLVIAHAIEQLDPKLNDKVLVIGTGTGYSTALLSRMSKEVFSIEIDRATALTAEETLRRLKYSNIQLKVGDGFEGWKEHAPFQKIIVECSPDTVPPALIEQLDEGGSLLIPVGDDYDQTMYLMKKVNGQLETVSMWPTLLVPMKGRAEELRSSSSEKPRPPSINNGGFEEIVPGSDNLPAHWTYVRQAKVIEGERFPEGNRALQFLNDTPGHLSTAIQAFPVDGKSVSEITLSFRVWGKEIRPGLTRQQLPRLEVRFFDEKRRPCGGDWVGGWFLTFDWVQKTRRFSVPRQAKFAIVQIGLDGATGEIRFDDLRITSP
ncbi:MAG: protein-L-isoaspartate O-methyltransferase [Planctomycetaceae bacterium]